MKKVAEILVVEDFTGKGKVSESKLQELLSKLNVEVINVTKIHIPEWENSSEDLTGVHLIVREVAET